MCCSNFGNILSAVNSSARSSQCLLRGRNRFRAPLEEQRSIWQLAFCTSPTGWSWPNRPPTGVLHAVASTRTVRSASECDGRTNARAAAKYGYGLGTKPGSSARSAIPRCTARLRMSSRNEPVPRITSFSDGEFSRLKASTRSAKPLTDTSPRQSRTQSTGSVFSLTSLERERTLVSRNWIVHRDYSGGVHTEKQDRVFANRFRYSEYRVRDPIERGSDDQKFLSGYSRRESRRSGPVLRTMVRLFEDFRRFRLQQAKEKRGKERTYGACLRMAALHRPVY